MALVLNVNSYATVDTADTYFADSLRSADWSALTASTQSAALIEATRYLDRLKWKGTKTDENQSLEFPRDGETVVVNEIIEATYEIAIRLAQDPTLIDSIQDQTGTNIKRVKADSVEVEFFGSSTGSPLFAWVQSLVGDLLAGGGSKFTVAGSGIATGTDGGSSFTNGYDRSGPFA